MNPAFLVGPDRAGDAAEALAQAFLQESATDYFFPPEEGGKLEKLRALFGWAVEYRMRTGLPVLGICAPSPVLRSKKGEGVGGEGVADVDIAAPPLPSFSGAGEGGALAGVATLRTPVMPDLAEAEAMWQEVATFFGPAAEARMERYEELQKRHRPNGPHHYLVAIGVRPEFQGQGLGGLLLTTAIAMAGADPGSHGIALDTGSDSNQRLYERFGFRLTGTEVLGDKLARFMFRPNES